MIGVIAKDSEWSVVEEFFELFKTPWERYRDGERYEVALSTTGEIPKNNEVELLVVYGSSRLAVDEQCGLSTGTADVGARLEFEGVGIPIHGTVLTFEGGSERLTGLDGAKRETGCFAGDRNTRLLRFGYDLFGEVSFLLNKGQLVDDAATPTLDMHVEILRKGMQKGGVSYVEIPPAPHGREFTVCLTHDIDFVGIRNHVFDHTMWGFLHRATVGSLLRFIRGRLSAGQFLKNWWTAVTLPLVYLGWKKDFWSPFEWYSSVERGLPATYFMIPFKRRCGENLAMSHAKRRATKYDIADVADWMSKLREAGNEIGVHGIDAWHDPSLGREERERVAEHTGKGPMGVRMHWLMRSEETFHALEEADYDYDSTVGFNETIGYWAGTGQVFCPRGSKHLLELPMHIQDGALFYEGRLNWSEAEAHEACEAMIQNSQRHGGVLTILWHDRSHAPERHWGEFYERMVENLKRLNVWFATAGQAVEWFRQRRQIQFERDAEGAGVLIRHKAGRQDPPVTIRVSSAKRSDEQDLSWDGEKDYAFRGESVEPAAEDSMSHARLA